MTMIRRLQKSDADAAAKIWLDANIQAHCFISAQYWKDHFEPVRDQLLQAEVYVYEDEAQIQGFLGLIDTYIAGIFVRGEAQSRGIGRQLLDKAKCVKPQLCLSVYKKNARAIKFYRRENFVIQCESTDENTGEEEYSMLWRP